MSLLDSLYKVNSKLETTDDNIMFSIALNPLHPLFEGHFPDQPILPGVIQLRMVTECVGIRCGRKASLKQVVLAKFIHFIDPQVHRNVDVAMHFTELGDEVEVHATLKYDDLTFTKCDLMVSLAPRHD